MIDVQVQGTRSQMNSEVDPNLFFLSFFIFHSSYSLYLEYV